MRAPACAASTRSTCGRSPSSPSRCCRSARVASVKARPVRQAARRRHVNSNAGSRGTLGSRAPRPGRCSATDCKGSPPAAMLVRPGTTRRAWSAGRPSSRGRLPFINRKSAEDCSMQRPSNRHPKPRAPADLGGRASTTSCAPSRPSRTTNDARLAEIERRRVGRRRHRREGRPHRPRARRAEARRRRARAEVGAPAAGRRRRPAPTPTSSTRRRSTPTCAAARAPGLRALETKAMSVGSDPDGGYLVPDETRSARSASALDGDLADPRASPACAQVSGNVYKKPFMTAGPATGWVGETDARPQTDVADARRARRSRRWSSTPCRRRPRRCSTTPPSTSTSGSPSEVEQAFAEQEGTAFVTGDGTNKPKGFLAYTTVANASWGWGNIGYIATGVAGAFAAERSVRRAGRSRSTR